MGFLEVDGASIAYRCSGSGPALLAPECNYTWSADFEALMAQQFTVIVASPRDFGSSTRTGAPYVPARWAADMLAATRHCGHDRFLVYGYSFTGAFGPWLAHMLQENRSVVAVASGGFPLLGDYTITLRDVESQRAELAQDPSAQAALNRRFDLDAGVEFYRALSALPPDGLVEQCPSPLYSFWGDQDEDAVGLVLPHAELGAGLTRRGVPWTQYPGLDHEGLNADLSRAWPDTAAWLLEQAELAGI